MRLGRGKDGTSEGRVSLVTRKPFVQETEKAHGGMGCCSKEQDAYLVRALASRAGADPKILLRNSEEPWGNAGSASIWALECCPAKGVERLFASLLPCPELPEHILFVRRSQTFSCPRPQFRVAQPTFMPAVLSPSWCWVCQAHGQPGPGALERSFASRILWGWWLGEEVCVCMGGGS